MPAQRDEPSAPPQAENDVCQRIVVALRATGGLVPAFQRGMRLPYGVRAELLLVECAGYPFRLLSCCNAFFYML